MNKFKVGDIIKANIKSNGAYCVTNQKCGWMGEVIEVVDENRIVARTIAPRSNYGEEYGQYCPLENEYFDIVIDGAGVTGLTVTQYGIQNKQSNSICERKDTK